MLSLQFQNLQPAISHTFCFFVGLWPLKLLLCTSSLRSSQINVMLINVLHLFLHCEQCKYNPMNFVVLTATFCLVSVVFTTSYTLNFLFLFRFKRFFCVAPVIHITFSKCFALLSDLHLLSASYIFNQQHIFYLSILMQDFIESFSAFNFLLSGFPVG